MSTPLVTFSELLEDAFLEPGRVDYGLLRRLYVSSTVYAPFSRNEADVNRFKEALAKGDYERAIEVLEPLLVVDPLDVSLRLAYSRALVGIDDPWEARTQRAVANGLVKALLGSGDGRTEATAIAVLDDREGKMVLSLLGVAPSTRRTGHEDGVWLERVVCADGRTVFLDVTWPQAWRLEQDAN